MTKVHNYSQVAIAEPITNNDEQQHFIGKTVVDDEINNTNQEHNSDVMHVPTEEGPTVIPTAPKYDIDVGGTRKPVVLSYCPNCSKQEQMREDRR